MLKKIYILWRFKVVTLSGILCHHINDYIYQLRVRRHGDNIWWDLIIMYNHSNSCEVKNVFVSEIFYRRKKARNTVTVEKRIGNSDGRTDMVDRHHATDGRRVQYLNEHVLRCKKGTFKNPGEFFFQKSAFFEKKYPVFQWKRVGLNLLYHFLNRGEILTNLAMFKYLST